MLRNAFVAPALGLSMAGGIALGYALARDSYPPVDVLLSTQTSVIGQSLSYPDGTPKITAAIVTMAPGASTGPHRHDVPLFAYMLEGEITVDYGADGSKTYTQGDAFIEAFKSVHNGTNTSDGIARVLAVFVGSDTAQNTVEEHGG